MAKRIYLQKIKTYSSLRYYILACVIILIVTAFWYQYDTEPKRVVREHAQNIYEEYKCLTNQVHSDSSIYVANVSRQEVEEDLDELEWLIENNYSYCDLREVDYKAALDNIRHSFGSSINRGVLALQLMKFIALFGDGHSRVVDPKLQWMCPGFLPFLVEESHGRFVAFQPDRADYVDPNFPFLRSIDGLPINVWLKAAGHVVPKGSSQFIRYHSIRNLRYVTYLREELNLPKSRFVQIELQSEDNLKIRQINLPLADKKPVYGFWPRTEEQNRSRKETWINSRILPGNIGYLQIMRMLSNPKFQENLIRTMNQFKKTEGLIIDIRGNGGGSRAPLRTLFPFFMANEDPPYVVNVAAYLYSVKDRKKAFELRYLYPASSSKWSKSERDTIYLFASSFKPTWAPSEGKFSEWHYFVISPIHDPIYFYYDKPVVVLMNRWNFSASDIFLGAFKGWRKVTLMGLPSGGGSGCRVKYQLHNSSISLYLSSMASYCPNGRLYEGNGILPDILVEPKPTDFIGKTDFALEEAVKKIQNVALKK